MRRTMLVCSLVVMACGQPPPTDAPTPTLRIGGAETATEQLFPRLIQSYGQSTGAKITATSSPDANAMRNLLNGDVEIAITSRIHTAAEEEQAQANGYSFAESGSRTILAVNVVAVALHPSKPLDSLSYDQVIDIFCTEKLHNWSEIGLEAAPIRPLARADSSGERILFEDFFCGPRGLGSSVEQHGAKEIAALLMSDPNAISFTSLTERVGKIVGLRPLPQSQPIRPNQQSVARGAYPLAHDLYLYTPGRASGSAADFITWIASPAGQEIVDEAHFIPLFLRPPVMDEPRPLRETIHFEQGSSNLTQRSQARLTLLVEELQGRAGEYNHIVLEGYTDGREKSTVPLSRQRAEVVRDRLQASLPGLFFEIIPRGAVNPLAPNETPFGRHQNRRVQIYLGEEEKDLPEPDGVEEEPEE